MDTEKSTDQSLHILYESITEGQPFLLDAVAKLLGAIDAKIIKVPATLHLLPLAANENRPLAQTKEILSSDICLVEESEIHVALKQDTHVFVRLVIRFESKRQAQRIYCSNHAVRLIPHIQQALGLSHQLNQQESDLRSVFYVLDSYPVPAIAIDDHFQTVFANRLAEHTLDSAPEVTRLPGCRETTGLLDICSHVQKKQLKHNLTQCFQYQCSTSKYMNLDINGESFPVVISPVDSVPNIFRELSRSSVVWVYFITGQYAKTLRNNPAFIALSLSSAETELTIQLFEGSSLDEISQNRRVSKQTVRKQLQSVLRKTRCDTQENLIILLFEEFIHYGLLT